MAMSSPVFNRLAGNMQVGNYNSTITFENVMSKAIMQFAVVALFAAATAVAFPVDAISIPVFGAMAITLILGFIIAFKRTANPTLIMLYAVAEGVFVGGLSKLYENLYHGIVPVAVLATGITAGVIILGMRAGILRTSGAMRRVFFYACIGYLIFSLTAIALSFAGIHLLTLGSPFAIAVSIFGTFMASFSFLTDVEDVNEALGRSLGKNEDWRLAFGLVVSLVWLYLEILRLIANIMAASNK